MIINPYRYTSGGGVVIDNFINLILSTSNEANLTLCLDAGDSASMPASGNQQWVDQSTWDNNFYLGTSGSVQSTIDPIFVGNVGDLGPSPSPALFAINNVPSRLFQSVLGRRSWSDAMHKPGFAFTIFSWWYASAAQGMQIWSTCDTTSSNIGTNYNARVQSLTIRRGTSGFGLNVSGTASTAAPDLNVWYCTAISADHVNGQYTFMRNGVTETIAATPDSLSSSQSTGVPLICRVSGDGDNTWNFNGGVAIFAIWIRALTPEQLVDLYNASAPRFDV